MQALKDKITSYGRVIGNNVLKVDNFLNHQIDVELMYKIGKEFTDRFSDVKVDKILTIEASGIAVACMAALHMKVPVVFAKKYQASNLDTHTYNAQVFSFTKNCAYNIRVDKNYILKDEQVLIIDDFLANGKAALGLSSIVEQAGGQVAGIGIVIEKGFQDGGASIKEKGYRLESLAIIDSLENQKIIFREEN